MLIFIAHQPSEILIKMKTIPSEAISAIAIASANIANKLSNDNDFGTIANNIKQPQISRKLQQHLTEANDPTSSNSLTNTATRLLQEESAGACDGAFLQCILSPTCRDCFTTLQENNIDWANVVPDTPCQDVLGFLVAGGHCSDVRSGGTQEQDTFCSAFDACVEWDEDDEQIASGEASGSDEQNATDEMKIDCSTLTECNWPGMHEHFLGDGVCHDAMPGCYNSKACNYDGGDCCEDTCHYGGSDDYGACGSEGFACADPSSKNCQPALARYYKDFCANEKEDHEFSGDILWDDDEFKREEELPTCGSGDTLYRLVMFDSWGDGWDETSLTLKERGTTKSIHQGGLEYGSQGTVHLCLTKRESKCYQVTVENGVWGNEISWELRPLAAGAPVLAAGGSPTDCTVPLGGVVDDCENTCDSSRPDTKIQDPNYKSYKDMESCIEKKCVIQVGNCASDGDCSECMQESSPTYCYANENFNVLIDCSMCSCNEKRPAYCDAKSSGASDSSSTGSSSATHGGIVKPGGGGGTANVGSKTAGTNVCGPEQTLKGTASLVKYSQCADMDQMMAMVTDFDNDNFGMLDLFEDCAHAYDEEPNHGGKSALDCMKILHSLIIDEEADQDGKLATSNLFKNAKGETLPENIGQAISTLAHHLYSDAESFCDCTSSVNKETPTCNSFINFKTLLYEAVDACRSLDAIDCAAWEEFYTPCKKNLIQMFDTVNFDNDEQCKYVETSCGGAGPFPAFRALDCGGEIAKSAWDFHTMYERGCLGSSSSSSSNSYPTPPSPATSPSTSSHSSPRISPSTETKKQYKPYNPNGESDEKKPYTSPADSDSKADSYTEKKTHHFFRNTFIIMILASVGFVVHKKRRENFNYMRFRQMREARSYAGGMSGSDSGGDYAGVSISDSSFEPPTLPPSSTFR